MKFIQSTLSLLPFLIYPALISASPASSRSTSVHKRDGYTSTCTIGNFDVPFLTAGCVTESGDTNESTIDLNNCIGNENGLLVFPSNGFTSTCSGFSTSGSSFSGQCIDDDGGVIDVSLDTNLVVTNYNGALTC